MQTATRIPFQHMLTAVFALLISGLIFLPVAKGDVMVLQNGAVISGKVLQQESSGVLFQTEGGTYRYPLAWVKDVKIEAATAPHASDNGRTIPDWAQIVSALANSGFAPAIQQVPATVIGQGKFKNVPYVSFRCAYGGYEINIFGDLSQPAAVQIGAMGYLQNSAEAKTNCVHFICSVLANADARKMVRTLKWNEKDVETNGDLTFDTLLPGEMGSYGGWWISVYNQDALAHARASDAELAGLALPRVATAQPMSIGSPAPAITNNIVVIETNPAPVATTQSGQITSYGTYTPADGWTAEELANAHPATATPVNNSDMVYPRTYDHKDGAYRRRR
jgi:hypothetical protein